MIKLLHYLFCLIIILSLVTCKSNAIEKGINRVDLSKKGKIKKVLILGNSIVRHSPRTEIGWKGDWGMAATTIDSDFVHILMQKIHFKDSSVVVRFKNIAEFEVNFPSFNLSTLDSLKNPDLLILRISENVDGKKAEDSNFIDCYDKLINYVAQRDSTTTVLVDGIWAKGNQYRWHGLWAIEKENVNKIIKDYALKKDYQFVENLDIYQDSTNLAFSVSNNHFIGSHPSNKGMRKIAERIWDYIGAYF